MATDLVEIQDPTIATVCAWCPEVHVLRMQRRADDVVIITRIGKDTTVIRNGMSLKVSHGICEPCRQRLS